MPSTEKQIYKTVSNQDIFLLASFFLFHDTVIRITMPSEDIGPKQGHHKWLPFNGMMKTQARACLQPRKKIRRSNSNLGNKNQRPINKLRLESFHHSKSAALKLLLSVLSRWHLKILVNKHPPYSAYPFSALRMENIFVSFAYFKIQNFFRLFFVEKLRLKLNRFPKPRLNK